MADIEKYEAAGINYKKGLERFMGKEDVYNKYLGAFLYDGSFEEFCAGVEVNDMDMAEKALFTLRGTIGNLSMDRLLAAIDAAIAGVRSKKSDDEIDKLIGEVNNAYHMACDAISSQM